MSNLFIQPILKICQAYLYSLYSRYVKPIHIAFTQDMSSQFKQPILKICQAYSSSLYSRYVKPIQAAYTQDMSSQFKQPILKICQAYSSSLSSRYIKNGEVKWATTKHFKQFLSLRHGGIVCSSGLLKGKTKEKLKKKPFFFHWPGKKPIWPF